MVFRIFAALLVFAITFTGYKVWKAMHQLDGFYNPSMTFAIRNEGTEGDVKIVEFLHYGCVGCKKTHAVLMDYAKQNPGVRVIVRPVPVLPEETQFAAERALAAGLQGKFWEMDEALSHYDGLYDDKFYREVCALKEIDCDRLFKDAKGDKVHEYGQENLTQMGMLGIKTAPALLINNTLYQPRTALTLPDLLRMVEAEKSRKE